ncbi:hypothetical protein LOK49_Contig7G00004 [Camellia lanceoleosa]|nr:hypothetical protein LOK49_Contig7G00004 [Camellia lanceoleosa]
MSAADCYVILVLMLLMAALCCCVHSPIVPVGCVMLSCVGGVPVVAVEVMICSGSGFREFDAWCTVVDLRWVFPWWCGGDDLGGMQRAHLQMDDRQSKTALEEGKLEDAVSCRAKVEKLIKELPSMLADLSNGDLNSAEKDHLSNGISFQHTANGTNPREAQSMLLERIASEMNRLKFYITHAQVALQVKLAVSLLHLEYGLVTTPNPHCLSHPVSSNSGANSGGSRWTRYCERKKQEALAMATKRKSGVNMAGRVLFKKPNVVSRSPRKSVKTRLNFRSNVAGIIKLVYAVKLREVHLAHLRTTPFRIMFEAILINQLDHTEFRKGDDLIVRIIKSYSVRKGKFVLGGRGVDVTMDDVKLLFGLQGGSAFLDMTPRPRPASDFVQRRCPGTSRITAKLVKDLLMEASYWLCEHMNIVKAKHGHRFPRFLRWDVGEVITDELVIQADEMAILEGRCLMGDMKVGLFEDDGVKETGVAGSGFARVKLEGRSYGKQFEGGVQNESWNAAYVMRYSERGGVSSEGVKEGDGEFLRSDSSLKGHNSTEFVGPAIPHIRNCDAGDSKIIMELKQEVNRLKKKIEMQSINLVEGFESIFKVKDEECKKWVAENAELRRSLATLEEQVVEQAVHNVTQHFAGVNVTNTRVDEYGLENLVDVGNGRDKSPTIEGGILVDASPVAYVPLVDSNEMHVPIQDDDSDVVVSPMLTEGCSVVDGVNSFVRNIKGKVRKNLKLSGYEYPELRRRGRVMNNEVSLSKPGGGWL